MSELYENTSLELQTSKSSSGSEYDNFTPNELPPKSGDYYYQDYTYVRSTMSDYDHKKLKDAKLFYKTQEVVQLSERDEFKDVEPIRDASILVTGFGMRNVESFQEVLRMSREERDKRELRKLWRDEPEPEAKEQEKKRSEASARTDTADTFTSTGGSRSSSDLLTQTETVTETNAERKKQLDYLLGLETELEEASEASLEEEGWFEDRFKYSTSKSIREAQKYLRTHRIFECFQFIVAHMLSSKAENPIKFIVNILNKCLLYRSGLGDPPLLYEKKHIAQLFLLMDRLQAGFIDYSQYKTGMNTLGICSYNENPEITREDLISQETFVEEAYEAEVAIFNEFIKKHPEKAKKKLKQFPSEFQNVSLTSFEPPYFIPSDLIRYGKGSTKNVLDYSDG